MAGRRHAAELSPVSVRFQKAERSPMSGNPAAGKKRTAKAAGEVREAQELEAAVRRRIRDLTPCAPERARGQRPWALIIAGQPGAGKTTLQKILCDELRDPHGRPRVALYDGDDNALVHPRYADLAGEHPFDGHHIADAAVPEDARRRYLDHLRAGGTKYDVVVSHPLGRLGWAEQWVRGFTGEGYRVSVAYIATHRSNSLLGIADRYQNSRDRYGYGRWVERGTHDRFYDEIPEVAHHLESAGLVDALYVVDREGGVVYRNERDGWGSWDGPGGGGGSGGGGRTRKPCGARAAIKAERLRPFTGAEAEYFAARVAYLRDPRRLGPGRAAEPFSDRVADARDTAERFHQWCRVATEGEPFPEAPREWLLNCLKL